MSEQPTGIFTMDADAYHADPCERPSLSASIAHLLVSQSPWHAWTAHPKLNPDYKAIHSDRFDLGTVAHSLLLEQREVEDAVTVVVADSWRTAAAKYEREQARADGKVALLASQVDAVVAMLKATRSQLEALEVDPFPFSAGRAEQALIWEEDGITCRALLDWLHVDNSAIDDFKTTSASADPERWTRTMFTIGADVQTAFHLRGLKAVTGVDALGGEPVMRYVVQETRPPYALSVIALGPDVLTLAEAKVERAIRRWRECLEADRWPGYPTQVCYAELPAWEETRFMEAEAREELPA